MSQYVVEGSNGVPGIADMRYSISWNSRSGRVLNLIVRPFIGSSITYRGVSITKIEGTNDHYRIKFGGLCSGYYLAEYGGRNERKVMMPAYHAKGMTATVMMADTHIRVFNWFYEADDLIVEVVLGKGRLIVVNEVASKDIDTTKTIESDTGNNIVTISVSHSAEVVDNMIAACRRNNIAFQLAA